MEKVSIRRKQLSFEDIWAQDKILVNCEKNPGILDKESNLPDNRQIFNLLFAMQERTLHPAQPIELDQDKLESVAKELGEIIQKVWGIEYVQKPAIELRTPEDYLPRINEIEKKVYSHFNQEESLLRSPPAMYCSPPEGVIVAPSKYLLVHSKDQSESMRTEYTHLDLPKKVEEITWDRPLLEEILTEELTHVLFRQIRGEWKDGYYVTSKKINEVTHNNIRQWNEIMAQLTKEKIALSEKPDWKLYTAAHRVPLVWANRYSRSKYVAARTLYDHPFVEIAVADWGESGDDINNFYFDSDHPNHEKKLERFSAAFKIKP